MKVWSKLLSAGILLPLHDRTFRVLWTAQFVASLTIWTNDIAAAWMMTRLTDDVLMVALVQFASLLPVFLLSLPSGALADIFDRRTFFVGVQIWVGLVALILSMAAFSGKLSPHGLLLLVFANGIGLAIRWPLFAASVPEIVPRERMAAAMSLGEISTNIGRIVGPLAAGVLLTNFGSVAVFSMNALLHLVALVFVWQWKTPSHASTLPGERFVGAVRVGLQHIWHATQLRMVYLRVSLLFFVVAPLTALMPLTAMRLDAGAIGFTLLMASMGSGAVLAGINIRWLQARVSRDAIVRGGACVQFCSMAAMAYIDRLALGCVVMACAGAAWISLGNTYAVAVQLALPRWVRARGMSVYLVTATGGSAIGALVWGQVASVSSVRTCLLGGALAGLLLLASTWRTRLAEVDIDVSPVDLQPPHPAAIDVANDDGPVMVTLFYQVEPHRLIEFQEVMRHTRAARLRQGSLSWGLFRDIDVPHRYVEYFVDETWIEHKRRQERFTNDDMALFERRRKFIIDATPSGKRFVVDQLQTSSPKSSK